MSKHIIFDDDSDDSTSEIICITEKPPPSEHSLLTCSLLKIRHEQSFGFEITGDLKKAGQHFLDSIEVGTAAHRAGLQRGDRIVRLNDVDVGGMNAAGLIGVMEAEVAKSGRQLELVVERTGGERSLPAKGDIFGLNDTYDMDTDESSGENDSASGLAGLKKRLRSEWVIWGVGSLVGLFRICISGSFRRDGKGFVEDTQRKD